MAASPSIELTDEWIAGIREIAPGEPTVPAREKRRVLMISTSTGYQHWVTPHTGAVIGALAARSGAFEVVQSEDPRSFAPDRLAEFDAVLFNNTCPSEPRRDLFLDLLQDEAQAAALRDGVLQFVAGGGGLVSIHGGILAFNNHAEWSEMQGGSFDRHPPQQELTVTAVDPDHLLAAAFGGEPLVHVDEPYFFTNAYAKKRFRPLLALNRAEIVMPEGQAPPPDACYAAWIKRYGEGRVFYCAPSHNAQSFEDPRLLRFILDGIQYALGDLACEDAPLA
jgi:type 1 glutamine amidotransferase